MTDTPHPRPQDSAKAEVFRETVRRNPLQMVGPWLTMESAPKDGRRIMLYSPKEGVGVGWWQHVRTGEPYDNAWTDVFGWRFYGCLIVEGDADMPTHWMPLIDGPYSHD